MQENTHKSAPQRIESTTCTGLTQTGAGRCFRLARWHFLHFPSILSSYTPQQIESTNWYRSDSDRHRLSFRFVRGDFCMGVTHVLPGVVADTRTHMSSFTLASSAVPDGHLAESTCGRGNVSVFLLHTYFKTSLRCSRLMPGTISCDRRPVGGSSEATSKRASDALA